MPTTVRSEIKEKSLLEMLAKIWRYNIKEWEKKKTTSIIRRTRLLDLHK